MVDIVSDTFKEAAKDYYMLLNRGYAERPTVKLVGDHYRLSRVQRMVLYRGITSKEKALARKGKIGADLQGRTLYIDGYNVLFTVMNYLQGKAIFAANDGILRDCGEVYGKVEDEKLFLRAADLLLEFLLNKEAERIEVYLDRSTGGNERRAAAVQERLGKMGTAGDVFLVQSADHELKQKSGGVLATSDSEIIDAAAGPVFDLARQTLETRFAIDILDLEKLL